MSPTTVKNMSSAASHCMLWTIFSEKVQYVAWQVLTYCIHKTASLRATLVAKCGVFARREVLLEAFSGSDSRSDTDGGKILRTAELTLLTVWCFT